MDEPSFLTGDFFISGECNFHDQNQFIIDDLLVDFPHHDNVVLNDTFFRNVIGNSADSSAVSSVTAIDSCDSSVCGSEPPFSGNVSSRSLAESRFVRPCVPYSDMADLERLSSFTQESISIVEVKNLHIISSAKSNPATDTSSSDSTPAVTAVDSCNSSVSGSELPFSGNIESQFSGLELRLQYNEMADLERLPSITQESFSIIDVKNLHNTSAAKKPPATDTSYSDTTPEFQQTNRITSHKFQFQPDVFIPTKPRTNRSRTGTAPYNWTSRILHLNQSISNTIKVKPMKPVKTTAFKRTGRKCMHCGCETTPQWRTGPMGPKTLCNACGVRYQSGRLVPEYRPAASPTFVPAKHSNSHRKVMEIRRQNEVRDVENGRVDPTVVVIA